MMNTRVEAVRITRIKGRTYMAWVFSKVARLVLILALAASAGAQTQTATVRGTVTDTSSGVVPGATLSLLNVDQNRPWKTVTNEDGEYVFVQIPPGNYKLEVEARGFKKVEREAFTLEVAQVLGLDIR